MFAVFFTKVMYQSLNFTSEVRVTRYRFPLPVTPLVRFQLSDSRDSLWGRSLPRHITNFRVRTIKLQTLGACRSDQNPVLFTTSLRTSHKPL
jgi:hypothetical protein